MEMDFIRKNTFFSNFNLRTSMKPEQVVKFQASLMKSKFLKKTHKKTSSNGT
jgi:hypothetical protein